jgi:hypothetical protein
MRIDARISDVYTGQQARRQTGNLSATSFSAAMDKAMANQSEKVDFSNMSIQELRDWMNGQLKSGEMPDEAVLPFVLMAGGGTAPDLTARHNFIQEMRGTIQFSLEHGDKESVKRKEAALQMMLKAMSWTE